MTSLAGAKSLIDEYFFRVGVHVNVCTSGHPAAVPSATGE